MQIFKPDAWNRIPGPGAAEKVKAMLLDKIKVRTCTSRVGVRSCVGSHAPSRIQRSVIFRHVGSAPVSRNACRLMTDGGPAHLPLHLQPILRVALAAPAVRDVRARQVDRTLNHLQDDDLRRKHQLVARITP